jgi:hypothetical protein
VEDTSARRATLAEYEKARLHLWGVIWLDPALVVSGMDAARRNDEFAAVKRLRIGLDDFERALSAP